LTATRSAALTAVKLAHTAIWAFFVVCIASIPLAAWRGNHRIAGWLVAIVALEVAVLLGNHMRCPLTNLASRYSDDRQENFDIYLPIWLARRNQVIFGALYFGGTLFAVASWLLA